jgi:hypothetical protein
VFDPVAPAAASTPTVGVDVAAAVAALQSALKAVRVNSMSNAEGYIIAARAA